MKRIITITAMLASAFFSQFSIAQNLVPNPSFEDTVACPTTGGQIYRAAGWQNWGITPDYFNSCNSGLLGTPINGFGNQVPVEGNAYAGLACNLSTVNNVREFFGRELSQPLVIGLDYYISFYVSLADISSLNCAINHIGAKFSTVPFDSIASPTLDNFAHVYDDSIISDTANWTKINGSFIADSAYTYVMFGNFFDNNHLDTLNCPTMAGTYSYYFFDMLCISPDPEFCSSDPLSINPIAVEGNNSIIYPIPADLFLYIEVPDKIKDITIYSTLGRLIFSQALAEENKVKISTSLLANGIYFIKIHSSQRELNYKFQIIHK